MDFMFARALKSNVIVSIAVLLFVGMVLIDFVAIWTFQRRAIHSEIDKARLLASVVEHDLGYIRDLTHFPLSPEFKKSILPVFRDTGISCAHIQSLDNHKTLVFGEACATDELVQAKLKVAMESGQRSIDFSGSVWGVFWWQRESMIYSAPLKMGGHIVGGVGLVKNFETLYQDLRRSQKFVLIYLFINIIILTFVGFHRLFKIFLEPIERLAKRAENYQETDGAFFPVRKQDNELQVLSKSLNSMTQRITADKKKLQETVHTLENTNTELEKAQEEIIRAEKLASIGRLSSGLAHEIGNPIGIIMGYLELLKQEDIQVHDKQDYILRTEKEIQRMDTVIRQLLDLSRPSDVDFGVTSIHEVLDDIAHVLKVQPLMSNIEWLLSLDATLDQVQADPNQLRQVFLNLAINAADALAADPEKKSGKLEIITILKEPDPSDIRRFTQDIEIRFVDNGPGIPQDILDNIFDPFFTTKAPGKGTGLGLYVCFMIIDSMGGAIHADSTKGQGTTMTITLPLASESSNA
jgi:two-component system, NtrC family, sensor kinase